MAWLRVAITTTAMAWATMERTERTTVRSVLMISAIPVTGTAPMELAAEAKRNSCPTTATHTGTRPAMTVTDIMHTRTHHDRSGTTRTDMESRNTIATGENCPGDQNGGTLDSDAITVRD